MTLSEYHPLSRRETRRQDRRDAILAVAAQSFLEHGYAGTTMSGIAAALGGSKGTLWSYFPSKEGLFAAVLENETAAFGAKMSQILNPCGDLTITLKQFCMGFMEKVTSPEAIALHRLVVAESGRFPEVGKIFFENGPRLISALLADYLSGAMDRGLLRKDDSYKAARSLISLCYLGHHQQLLMGLIEKADPEMFEADVDWATSLFLRAFAIGNPA